MSQIKRLWIALLDAENEFTRNPSKLLRLEIDNLRTRLAREVVKLEAQGCTPSQIEEGIKEHLLKISPNNGEAERLIDYDFSLSRQKK